MFENLAFSLQITQPSLRKGNGKSIWRSGSVTSQVWRTIGLSILAVERRSLDTLNFDMRLQVLVPLGELWYFHFLSWIFHAALKGRSSLRHCLARISSDAFEQCQMIECLAHSLPHHIELGQCPCNSHSLEPKIAVSLASRTPLAVIHQGSLNNPCYPATNPGRSILLPQFLMQHSANLRRKKQIIISKYHAQRWEVVLRSHVQCPFHRVASELITLSNLPSLRFSVFTCHETLPVVTLWPAHTRTR